MSKELALKEKNLKENLNPSNNEKPSYWSSVMQRRMGEGLFILIAAISLFVLLSLVSYEKTDPSWFGQASFRETAVNSGGWVGAHLADILLLLFGFLAYGLPILIVYLAWVRLYPERYSETDEEPVSNRIRLLGALLLILGASGLVSFEFSVSTNILPHTAGGLIGDLFSKGLDSALNPTGTLLLLVTLCFMGITLLTGLSWIVTAETVGSYTMLGLQKVTAFSYTIIGKIHAFIQRNREKIATALENRRLAQQLHIEQVLRGETQSQTFSANPTPSFSRDKTPSIDEAAVSTLSASVNRSKVTLGLEETKPDVKPSTPTISGSNNYTRAAYVRTENTVKSVEKPSSPSVPSSSYVLNKLSHDSLPPLSLLEPPEKSSGKGYTSEQLESMAREVEQRLLDFGIEVQVVAVNPGPVITRFELQLAAGIKVSRISGLAKDLARSLSVISVRVVDVIPGKPVIGLELPNQYREMVRLSEIFLTDQFQQARSPVSMALGVDISGYPVVVDLAKMPHLLVAGTTGSGKSVGLNAMLLSILFKATPDEVRLILVDPKMLEFSIYDRIPHLLTPVVTDMKEAAGALRWSVAEMERRYRLMSALGVRNLAAFNNLVKEAEQKGEPIKDPLWKKTQDMDEVPPYLTSLPYIVVVIDELADMMMVVGKKVEQLIARIAQKARAAGIHLILATQRPSVDVLTGLIKSNIPTRIAFQVSSKIDSRTILDQQGADQLLGHGDMLYLTPGSGAPMRIHGAFVDDKEVHRVAEAWRERGDPQYVDVILRNGTDGNDSDGFGFSEGSGDDAEDADPLYDEAVRFVTETRKASISSVQRRLKVGYNRAARLIEEMERTGVVSAMESNGVRDVLAPPPPED